jgi:peptide/nickel transport system permease protein
MTVIEPLHAMSPAPPADGDGATAESSTAIRISEVLTRRPAALIGLVVLIALAVVALAAPLLAPGGGDNQVGPAFQPPSAAHWLGLSDRGVDMISALTWALRVSLLVGFSAGALTIAIGAAVGILAGYFGGWVDLFLTLLTDYFIVIPALPVLIVVAAVWGASLWHIIIILGLLMWTTPARVIRAQVKTLRERTFVKRARAFGASHWHVVFHHVTPHVAPLVLANAVLAVAGAIFAETALAFLGLADPTQTSLGKLIQDAYDRAAISDGAWWTIVPPGLLVAVIVLSASLVGLMLEEALSPRASHMPFRLAVRFPVTPFRRRDERREP